MEAALLEQQLLGTGTGMEDFRAKPSEPTPSTPYYKEPLFFFHFSREDDLNMKQSQRGMSPQMET